MGWAALVGEGVFLTVAIGLRVWMQRRWTGKSGIVVFSQRRTAAERVASACFGVAAIGIGVGTVIRLGEDTQGGLIRIVQFGGLALLALGIAVTVWAQFAMGDAWRVGVDHDNRTALVTTGPFRSVRNPIYTGMAIFAAGVAAMIGNLPSLVALAALLAGLELQVRLVEEPFLEQQHGPRFREWARDAGRFLPGVGCLPAD